MLHEQPKRQHSHKLDAKGLSQQNHPSKLSIRIHQIKLDDTSRVTLKIRNMQKTISAVPYAHTVDFDLNYHSLVFDTLKIDILRQQLLSHTRVAQASIKLSELEIYQGDELHTFNLVDISRKHETIGTITIKMAFEYGRFQLSTSTMDIPFTESPTSSFIDMPFSRSPHRLPDSPRSSYSSTSTSSIDRILQSFNLVSSGKSDQFMENSSTTSRTIARSSTTMSYNSKSSKEGINTLIQLYQAYKCTGWKMSTVDFGRGLSALKDYNDYYPTPKTLDIVTDLSVLKIGAYFLHFIMPSYGAVVLNYFGYGKITDMLKIDQDKKAAIAHLKIQKKHLLEWEYSSHGIFSEKPNFFVCYDEKTQSIVVSIRGTFVFTY